MGALTNRIQLKSCVSFHADNMVGHNGLVVEALKRMDHNHSSINLHSIPI